MVGASPASSAESKLEKLRLQYQIEVEKLQQPLVVLRAQYRERLLELEKKYKDLGDLSATLAAKAAASAEDDPTPDQIAKSPAEIAKVQQTFLDQKALKGKKIHSEMESLRGFYRKNLAELRSELTKADELEKASAVDAELTKMAAYEWQVIFRAADPKLWDTDSDSESGFARKLSSLPKDTKFLKMRNGKSSVIIPMTFDQLPKYVDLGGGVKWNGTAYFDSKTLRGKKYESVCLGIGSKEMSRKHGVKGGIVTVDRRDRNKRPEGLGGWGFGRSTNYYASQQSFWAGEPREGDFEISVTSRELSPEESQSNLVK